MTDRSLIKKPRPIVFSLAELEKYPTLEDRYAVTLPFDPVSFSCCHRWTKDCVFCKKWDEYPKVKAKCIKRTAERWAWFSAARDLDDERGERLGTLGYLPREIRQEIMKALVLYKHDDNYPDSETITPRYPEEEIDPFMFAGYWSDSESMRLASPSTRVEFEYCYLTETSFVFDKPRHLEAFLDKLSIDQQSLLRSFTFDLYSTRSCYGSASEWVAVFARLPPNLKAINFDMWVWVSCAKGGGGEWFICGTGWEKFQPAIDILDILGKRARRYSARAKIGLGARYYDSEHVDLSCEVWVRVLNELEPWSRDWLKWWEEATKIDSDDGEGAIEMAQVMENKP